MDGRRETVPKCCPFCGIARELEQSEFKFSLATRFGANGASRSLIDGVVSAEFLDSLVSLLQLSPFFASIFPLFLQKRLILRLLFSSLHFDIGHIKKSFPESFM